jgi:pimeloyl-ACP methyl ester carboxylesterase
MATAKVNGVRLYYELNGTGPVPLVLVHGSWDSHHNWDLVVPPLAEVFRVLTYDRRGHSQSDRSAGQGSVREDVADLAALIKYVAFMPAWVVGNSFGASITLRLATAQPDLFRGIIAHEPPLFSLLADVPSLSPMLDDVQRKFRSVVERISSGDHAGGAEQFVETVALGPGTWATLPPAIQRVMIENAPTFLDEANDPDQVGFELDRIKMLSMPVVLTRGDQSPPVFEPVVSRLSGAIPHAEVATLPGAGHVPHETHPDAYVETIVRFTRRHPK